MGARTGLRNWTAGLIAALAFGSAALAEPVEIRITHSITGGTQKEALDGIVADFEKANPGMRPNFMSVGGYDGIALIYKALEKTGGDTNGAKLLAAMKGMSWTSPRGPISIDPDTRDIVQNVYIRKAEKKDGQIYNVEFATVPNVKDPLHGKK